MNLKKIMDSKLQMLLAKKAGKVPNSNETWLEAYEYHLGMVENPFPFERFKMKFNRLNHILAADPDGRIREYDQQINTLCKELGY